MNDTLFTIVIFAAISLSVGGFVVLLLLGFFEREFDYLQLENKQIRLEKELQRMEYLQLSQQIQPHFLFNSLNAMLSLGRLGRSQEVVEAMEQFSQFLRYKYVVKDPLVPFELELEHTKHYLSIQQLRFGHKLTITFHIEEEAEPTMLPPYILQTFVENAFKHGLEKKIGDKHLQIELIREGSWVRLTVKDNGPNPLVKEGSMDGIGLANIRKRLNLLFDLETSVELKRIDDWSAVTARWPYSPGEGGYKG